MEHTRRFSSLSYQHVVFICIALFAAGCAGDPFGSGRQIFEVSIVVVSGDDQVMPSGGTESAPLVVRVEDQRGTPYRDITIAWSVNQGSGSLSSATSRTDANGRAQVTYQSGSAAGDVEVTAVPDLTSGGLTASKPIAPVSFKLTVSAATDSAGGNDG